MIYSCLNCSHPIGESLEDGTTHFYLWGVICIQGLGHFCNQKCRSEYEERNKQTVKMAEKKIK